MHEAGHRKPTNQSQPCVGSKMVAAHVITITCELYIANKVQQQTNFYPCYNDIAYARFEDLKRFCMFFERLEVFVGQKDWVNLPVDLVYL